MNYETYTSKQNTIDSRTIYKIDSFLTKEFFHGPSDIAIFKNDDGSYEIFNRYFIALKNNNYVVTMKHNSNVKVFSNLKNAVTWCMLDKRNMIRDSVRVEELDKALSGISVSIRMHMKLIKDSKDIEFKMIQAAKLNEDQLKRKSIKKEMTAYINNARSWQERRFNRQSAK